MKFKKLQRLLGVNRIVTIGTLEMLWIATQKNAPQGDIGKFSDLEIAIECEWEGDPETLVSALVESGWLDVCDTHRLVVHDWEHHAPGWISRQLKRHQKSFVTASSSKSVTGDGLEATKRTQSVTDDALEATPNLTQPNLTQPNLILLSSSDDGQASKQVTADQVFQLISNIDGIKKATKLTKERRQKINTRLKDPEWPSLLLRAREKLPIPGDGWQPDIDWLVANGSNVVKLIEGKYDWRAGGNKASPAQRTARNAESLLERMK